MGRFERDSRSELTVGNYRYQLVAKATRLPEGHLRFEDSAGRKSEVGRGVRLVAGDPPTRGAAPA